MNKSEPQKNKLGFWPSKISAQALSEKSTRFGQIHFFNNRFYSLESRPEENGRGVIVSYDGQKTEDVTEQKYSVRTRVHEYGSGDFWGEGESLIFCNDADQCLYLQSLTNNKVEQLTQASQHKRAYRYADGDITKDGRFTVCVREFHPQNCNALQVVNDLVLIDLASKELKVLVEGSDFYANPRFSPDGKQLLWISWRHPNMPWDETELWCADIDKTGTLTNQRLIAGGKPAGVSVSVYNPQWSAKGDIYYAADNNGWWHLYKASNPEQPIHPFVEMEFAFPQWQFACNSFQIFEDKLIAIGIGEGQQALYSLNLESGELKPFEQRLCAFNGEFVATNEHLYFIAASELKPQSIYRLSMAEQLLTELKPALSQMDARDVSVGQHISFPSSKDSIAHGYFYPATNSQFKKSDDQLAPLIVMSHGGPTGMSDNGFDLEIQYWTSRGFAVADVNYRGSTGYGRQYRDSLKGQWGIYDVDDCIAMAKYLAEKGLVDSERWAIRGGSAGGFTTLSALTFHDQFKVGMSRYGVADLESLATDSHKFEIRYLDSCIGPLPEARALYKERSPIEHTDKLSCPILILQGLEDMVVPPNQSQAMVNALEEKGLDYQYITFEGEGHGFRKPETIVRAYSAELNFYQQYLL